VASNGIISMLNFINSVFSLVLMLKHINTKTDMISHICEISGSHGSKYDDDTLQGYSAVQAARTSEMLVYFETTRRYIPEGCSLQPCVIILCISWKEGTITANFLWKVLCHGVSYITYKVCIP
jgi:hypothetical protein